MTEPSATTNSSASVRTSVWPGLFALLSVLLFTVAAWILVREIRTIGLQNIIDQFRAIPAPYILLALLFSFLSYLVLTCYDLLAFRYLGENISFAKVAPIAFSAFAVGHNVGVASLSGGAIRYRAYSLLGISATQIATLIAFIPVTFFLGATVLLGIVLIIEPENALSSFDIGSFPLRVAGLILLAIVACYLALLATYRQPLRIRSWQFRLPSMRTGIYQILLSSIDIAFASLVLYVLLRASTDISYFVVLGAFLLAMVVGIVSSVPGAMGVFEGALVLLLPEVPLDELLGAVIAYRLIYYLIPLLVAVGVIAAQEIREQKIKIQEFSEKGMDWGSHIVPQTFGTATFLAGAYLLVRGSLPLNLRAARVAEALIPSQLLEISHLVSSVVGAGLLLVARGLYRRLHRAWLAAIVLLVAALVATVLQFHGWIHFTFLAFLLLLIWVSRSEFYRGKPLMEQKFDSSWIASITLVMIATIGIGLLANQNVEYSNELWWQFSLDGEASRMLRATFLALLLLGGFALARFLRAKPDTKKKLVADELAVLKNLIASDDSSFSNVALLGDKRFLLHPSGEAFLMYQVSGSSWIALSDPVGNKDKFEEILWQFREACDTNNAHCVLYQVSDNYLPLYLDLGLSLLKLGEEGTVSLTNFGLEGSHRADLRQAYNKAKRVGAEFSVTPASEVHAIIDDLARVSDAWLKSKSTQEKGFSLGYFDREYISNFDCALIKMEGEIVAFANLWKGGTGVELSLDLMRYSDKAPKGVMDYLFTEIMLWGKQNNFQVFSLGMAPLSGLEQHELASTWHKLGNLVFRFGENFYNFEGLRQYKEKFEPDWEPRYLACKGGWSVPSALLDTTVLISGGYGGLLPK